MPNRTIELTCYKLEQLGIYSAEGEAYLPPKKLMEELKGWAFDSEKKLVETQTYEPNSQTLEAYCLDFHESNGDYILALWNRVASTEKGIGSVKMTSTSKHATVKHTKIDKDSIPGYPSFFFISPRNKLFAPISIDSKAKGIMAFRSYVKGYINVYCSHKVNRVDGETLISGLCKTSSLEIEGDDNRFPDKKALVRCALVPDVEKIERERLLENAINITKVVKDLSTLEVRQDDQSTMFERTISVFRNLPLTERKTTRITMPVSVDRTHVQKMLDDYDNNDSSEEYNLGIIIKGEANKVHWLSGTTKTLTLKGDLIYHAEEQPDLESLMKLIQSSKEYQIDQQATKQYITQQPSYIN